MAFLKKIFGDSNLRVIGKLKPLVEETNSKEKEISKLSDSSLKAKTTEFREKIKKATEKVSQDDEKRKIEGKILNDILPDAFACTREAGKRTLKQRHFDVQLIGGIALHQGKIAEMKTGEGKTLVATLAVYLNALPGRGVHVVTVNDYLAKRDAGWMGRIYDALGLIVGCIVHEQAFIFDKNYKNENTLDEREENLRPVSRKEAYDADITYGTNNEFGFDYLKDNMVQNLGQMVQRGHNFAIVDEVDSILIDEARTPLIISQPAEESTDKYYQFAQIAKNLKEEVDYEIDEKMNAVALTDEGIRKIERVLGVQNIYEERGIDEVHHIEQALKAHALFKLDKDYVVRDGEVIIVDEFTGRLMPGRRYSEGLHQAIEAKEGVEIKRESLTLATISFQNYFRMYSKLAGMTGTAETEAEEFQKIYKLEVLVIPTNKSMIRKDQNDVIYKNEEAKFKAVVEKIKELNKNGQPVLVGTVSIEKNEILSNLLRREGIKHELLNAKNHEKEAIIISKAGQKGAVTVATNMAGRGTDIVLGDGIAGLGGLFVIGTERHEARRIDNQLRGRSGRQGDPGFSQFYISLDDDLMRIFGSDRVKAMMERLGLPENRPIEHPFISKSLESAQRRVEGHNFDIRKNLVEYDDVMNKQREIIYKKRRLILESEFDEKTQEEVKEEFLEMIRNEIRLIIDSHTNVQTGEIETEDAWNTLNSILPLPEDLKKEIGKLDSENAKEKLIKLFEEAYEKKEKETGKELMRILERAVYLRTIDMLWIDHLDIMTHLREGIGLRGYAQRDPLIEYKKESYNMFQTLLLGIRKEIVYNVFKVQIQANPLPEEIEQQSANSKQETVNKSLNDNKTNNSPDLLKEKPTKQLTDQPINPKNKVGRNDPCPCGSGKKYKKCCGK
ncbi:MAG: preprotein translocase subunit SecA [Patescibacteria group bacterium]|nr:preprotein translocase subunit SecA [Patescibacteria group bacterium]